VLTVTKLDIQRQTIVGNALGNSLAAVRPVPLAAATRTRGEAVVAATEELRLFADLNPAKVDRPTDTVAIEFDRLVEGHERVLRDDVVPLGPAQLEALSQARLVRTRVFPQGTAFTHRSMDLQWSELVGVRARMQQPDVAAAIDGLGLRAAADHLLAHIELYGRIVGSDANKARAGQEKASAAWNETFRLFVAQVLLDYENDPAMKQELLGTFEAQLAQQRAALRAKKAGSGAGSEAEPPAPPPAPTQASTATAG